MAKEGFTLVVGGEEVYTTDEKVLSVAITSEQGELTRFGVADIHRLNFTVQKETGFNKHLNEVEREQREARKEAVAAEEGNSASESVPEPVTETETEEESETEDAGTFSFGEGEGTE